MKRVDALICKCSYYNIFQLYAIKLSTLCIHLVFYIASRVMKFIFSSIDTLQSFEFDIFCAELFNQWCCFSNYKPDSLNIFYTSSNFNKDKNNKMKVVELDNLYIFCCQSHLWYSWLFFLVSIVENNRHTSWLPLNKKSWWNNVLSILLYVN